MESFDVGSPEGRVRPHRAEVINNPAVAFGNLQVITDQCAFILVTAENSVSFRGPLSSDCTKPD